MVLREREKQCDGLQFLSWGWVSLCLAWKVVGCGFWCWTSPAQENSLLQLSLPCHFSLPLEIAARRSGCWTLGTCRVWEKDDPPSAWAPQGKTGPLSPPSLRREHLAAAYWSLGCYRCRQDTLGTRESQGKT